jgi:hypothetical protein
MCVCVCMYVNVHHCGQQLPGAIHHTVGGNRLAIVTGRCPDADGEALMVPKCYSSGVRVVSQLCCSGVTVEREKGYLVMMVRRGAPGGLTAVRAITHLPTPPPPPSPFHTGSGLLSPRPFSALTATRRQRPPHQLPQV